MNLSFYCAVRNQRIKQKSPLVTRTRTHFRNKNKKTTENLQENRHGRGSWSGCRTIGRKRSKTLQILNESSRCWVSIRIRLLIRFDVWNKNIRTLVNFEYSATASVRDAPLWGNDGLHTFVMKMRTNVAVFSNVKHTDWTLIYAESVYSVFISSASPLLPEHGDFRASPETTDPDKRPSWTVHYTPKRSLSDKLFDNKKNNKISKLTTERNFEMSFTSNQKRKQKMKRKMKKPGNWTHLLWMKRIVVGRVNHDGPWQTCFCSKGLWDWRTGKCRGCRHLYLSEQLL